MENGYFATCATRSWSARLAYDPTDNIMVDPDSAGNKPSAHLFILFARAGSAGATVQQFNADGLLVPVRVRTGTHQGYSRVDVPPQLVAIAPHGVDSGLRSAV